MPDSSRDDLLFLRLQRALVGSYSLERQIGRGGMGVVFLARDVRLDRPVAIKLLRPEVAGQSSFRERFLNEARTAARLSHPHLVSIHAVEEADDLVYFVMAYIEGETLGERIRRQGPLSSDEASRVLREVAWALSYAHASGVIHRDIKADNILLERSTGRALLADFGIAQAAGSADSEPLVGTTTYLSPELIEGRAASPQSDLYALGVVGFFAVSGQLPFDGATGAEVMARHLAQPVPRVDDAAPGVSARLARAIDRCLAKQPEARFLSAEDFAAGLEHHAVMAPVQPAAIQHWLRRWDRIAPLYAISMPIVGMLLILGGWTEWYSGNYYLWVSIYNWPEFVLILALGAQQVFDFMALRRLLNAGYRREDLVLALKEESSIVSTRRDFRPMAPLPARLIRDLTYVSLGVMALASLAVYFIIPRIIELQQARYVFFALLAFITSARLFTYIGLGIGMVYPGRFSRPGNWWQRLQLSFWRSPLGTVAVRLASIGLRPQLAEQTVHRPTEVALSLAADQLFAALPPALQADLGDVPGLLKALEQQATALRTSIDELEAAGIGSDSTGDPDRQALSELRRATEKRHGDVIGALERVRLQLIRVAAGASQAPELTEVLLAARRLESDLSRSVAGQDSVRRLLGKPRHLSGATPSPSPV